MHPRAQHQMIGRDGLIDLDLEMPAGLSDLRCEIRCALRRRKTFCAKQFGQDEDRAREIVRVMRETSCKPAYQIQFFRLFPAHDVHLSRPLSSDAGERQQTRDNAE